MRTAQAVETGLFIGLLVGVTFGFVAGVGRTSLDRLKLTQLALQEPVR
jgi:hypothetical protein